MIGRSFAVSLARQCKAIFVLETASVDITVRSVCEATNSTVSSPLTRSTFRLSCSKLNICGDILCGETVVDLFSSDNRQTLMVSEDSIQSITVFNENELLVNNFQEDGLLRLNTMLLQPVSRSMLLR